MSLKIEAVSGIQWSLLETKIVAFKTRASWFNRVVSILCAFDGL